MLLASFIFYVISILSPDDSLPYTLTSPAFLPPLYSTPKFRAAHPVASFLLFCTAQLTLGLCKLLTGINMDTLQSST